MVVVGMVLFLVADQGGGAACLHSDHEVSSITATMMDTTSMTEICISLHGTNLIVQRDGRPGGGSRSALSTVVLVGLAGQSGGGRGKAAGQAEHGTRERRTMNMHTWQARTTHRRIKEAPACEFGQ